MSGEGARPDLPGIGVTPDSPCEIPRPAAHTLRGQSDIRDPGGPAMGTMSELACGWSLRVFGGWGRLWQRHLDRVLSRLLGLGALGDSRQDGGAR